MKVLFVSIVIVVGVMSMLVDCVHLRRNKMKQEREQPKRARKVKEQPDGSEKWYEMSRKTLEREEKIQQMSRRYAKEVKDSEEQISQAQKVAQKMVNGMQEVATELIDFSAQVNEKLAKATQSVSTKFCQMMQGNVEVSTCAEKTFANLKTGIQYLNTAFQEVAQVTKLVNGCMNMPGISSMVKTLGPIGIGINLGVQFINALSVISDKGLARGIKVLMNTPDDSQKQLNEMFYIQNQIGQLEEHITDMFEKLSDKIDMNSAKQNIHETIDILLHMDKKLKFMNSECINQIHGNDMTKQLTDEPECLLAKKKFLDQGNSLNFPYHVNMILQMYSGDLNILGMDYFSQLSKTTNGDQELLNTHYMYFQNLITSSITSFFVYNQLYARQVYTDMFADLRANQRDALIKNKGDVNTLKTILSENDYELVLNMLTTTCDECTELNENHKRAILVGDLLFCSRVPDFCKMDKMKKDIMTNTISEEEQVKIDKNTFDPTATIINLEDMNKKAISAVAFNQAVKQGMPSTYRDNIALFTYIVESEDHDAIDTDSFAIISQNVDEVVNYKAFATNQRIQQKIIIKKKKKIYNFIVWDNADKKFNTELHKSIYFEFDRYFKYYSDRTIFTTNRLSCLDDVFLKAPDNIKKLNPKSLVMYCHSQFFDIPETEIQNNISDFADKKQYGTYEQTTKMLNEATFVYQEYYNAVRITIYTHKQPFLLQISVFFTQ